MRTKMAFGQQTGLTRLTKQTSCCAILEIQTSPCCAMQEFVISSYCARNIYLTMLCFIMLYFFFTMFGSVRIHVFLPCCAI